MNDMDHLLSSEPEVVPSAGFAASVMSAVRDHADDPPLAFPWRRFATGLALCILVTGLVVLFLLRAPASELPDAAALSSARAIALFSAGLLLTLALVRGTRLLIRA
jgi:hypothetical protein